MNSPAEQAWQAEDDHDEDESFVIDDNLWCDQCGGDGRDPYTDYLLPCPACQGEQH